MNSKKILVALYLVLNGFLLAQEGRFNGTVLDSSDLKPLYSASVKLFSSKAPGQPIIRLTDRKGAFEFAPIQPGIYLLDVSYVGYKDFKDTIRVSRRGSIPAKIILARIPVLTDEVEITGKAIPAEQKEDTIIYSAKAFKVNSDATAEDLVTKIPGIQKDGTTIKAQGEEVKQVFVDGKQFFGDDPSIALRNLPADVVEKVQVYDRMSDQAQFTGFDDGNSTKAINIITRMGRRNGKFGKLYAGYGTEDRFAAGATVNLFNQEQRITMLALTNNVNKQNFAMQDILGVSDGGGGFGGRGGMGGGMGRAMMQSAGGMGRGQGVNNFMVGNQDGNTKTHSAGISYIDDWGGKLTLNSSYFFNYSNNKSDQALQRSYFSGINSTQVYDEHSNSQTNNYNNRINIRAEYNIDSSNSVVFSPRISFQDNKSQSLVTGSTFSGAANRQINSTDYNNQNHSRGYNYSGELLLRHKFETPGRTLSINLTSGANSKNSDGDKYSLSRYFGSTSASSTLVDQESDQTTKGASVSTNINFTEPIHTDGILQFTLAGSYNNDKSDKEVDSINSLTGAYNLFDTLHSNKYENNYYTARGGVAYRVRSSILNLSTELFYQRSRLDGSRIFPLKGDVDKSFGKLLPSARLMLRFSRTDVLRFNYHTSLNAPSISQLQNTVDNTNTLFQKAGNPGLLEEYTHRLSAQYMTTNFESGTMFFVMANYNYTKNYIGTYTFTAPKDTTLPGGIFLNRGAQLTYPVNLDHSNSFRSFVNYGRMIHPILCNLNVFISASFSKSPGVINDLENNTSTITYMPGIALNSSVSEDLDFRISYNPTFYKTSNSLQDKLDNEYTLQNLSASFNWVYFWNLFVRTDMFYSYNSGLQGEKKYTLVNLGLGTKLFEDKSGELKFEVMDLLNQNKSLNKNVTETYVENRNTLVLQRFYLLTFTYNLRIRNQE